MTTVIRLNPEDNANESLARWKQDDTPPQGLREVMGYHVAQEAQCRALSARAASGKVAEAYAALADQHARYITALREACGA